MANRVTNAEIAYPVKKTPIPSICRLVAKRVKKTVVTQIPSPITNATKTTIPGQCRTNSR